MTPKKSPYDNLTAKAARGEYELVEPLDYLVLGHLEHEGAMFAGAYALGHTAVQLSKELFKGKVTAASIASRLIQLRKMKLVVDRKGIGTNGKNIWQSTAEGQRVANEWKSRKEKENA